MRVLLINMLLKWLVLVIRLLKDEHWFVLEAQLTEVDFMRVDNVVPKSLLRWELSQHTVRSVLEMALLFAL